jgi:hypothetical protein
VEVESFRFVAALADMSDYSRLCGRPIKSPGAFAEPNSLQPIYCFGVDGAVTFPLEAIWKRK